MMDSRIIKVVSIVLGALFGFLLVSVGATTFDYQAKMFLFEDFQLPIVLAVAMVTGMTGVWMLRRMNANTLIDQSDIEYIKMPFTRRMLIGSILFGIGWALTASCPGTAVAMLGEGKLVGVPVVIGILSGTWLFGLYNNYSSNKSNNKMSATG
jgi:uncharacterized membrane protein YedE/YeeE